MPFRIHDKDGLTTYRAHIVHWSAQSISTKAHQPKRTIVPKSVSQCLTTANQSVRCAPGVEWLYMASQRDKHRLDRACHRGSPFKRFSPTHATDFVVCNAVFHKRCPQTHASGRQPVARGVKSRRRERERERERAMENKDKVWAEIARTDGARRHGWERQGVGGWCADGRSKAARWRQRSKADRGCQPSASLSRGVRSTAGRRCRPLCCVG